MKVSVWYPHKLIGEALAGILAGIDGVEISDQITAQDGFGQVMDASPDVAVISAYYLKSDSGIIGRIKQQSPSTAVVVISYADVSSEFVSVIQQGASGYVTQDSTLAQWIKAVEGVHRGEIVVVGVDRRNTTTAPKAEPARDPAQAKAMNSLTPREREVLALLSKGFSNRQIAEDLFLSEHTVRTHIQNLRSKLNVRSKFQAAMVAMQVPEMAPAVSAMQF